MANTGINKLTKATFLFLVVFSILMGQSVEERAKDMAKKMGARLELTIPEGGYAKNSKGKDEIWFSSKSGKKYFLLSDGDLYEYGTSIENSRIVVRLAPSIYQNPEFLTQTVETPSSSPQSSKKEEGKGSIELFLEEEIDSTIEMNTNNAIVIDTSTEATNGPIAAYNPKPEGLEAVSLIRRMEVVTLISIPFAMSYARITSDLISSGTFFIDDLIPGLSSSFGNPDSLESTRQLFWVFTSVVWVVAIVRNDFIATYGLPGKRASGGNISFIPSLDAKKGKDGKPDVSMNFSVMKGFN